MDKHSARNDSSPPVSSPKGRKKAKQPVDKTKWRVVTGSIDLSFIRTHEEEAAGARPYFECKGCQSTFQVTGGTELEAMRTHWEKYVMGFPPPLIASLPNH